MYMQQQHPNMQQQQRPIMNTSNSMQIRFKNRNATNQSDKGIAEQYNQGGPFDVELQTSDGKTVSAHRFVLATFSKTWANAMRTIGIDGVIALPIDEPYHVTKKLIELLYFREINVALEEHQSIIDALNALKICGIDNSFKTPASMPPQQMGGQQMAAKIAPQRRASVAVTQGSYTPAKRTVRSVSVHPDQMIRENNAMLPPSAPPRMNPNRNSINTAAMKLPSQLTISTVPRSVNANGGSTQPVQMRQPQQQRTPPPQQLQQQQQQQQHQGQMVTPNRQPTQNQVQALLKSTQLTVKKSNPAATQKQVMGPPPTPAPQKSVNVQATQKPSKIPTGPLPNVPSGISIKQAPRNNQQLQQQQQQQQSIVRTAQTQPPITMIPTPTNHTENSPAKSVASSMPAAATVVQNAPNGSINQNSQIGKDIDDLPNDMEVDDTIGNGTTNGDEEDNGIEDVGNGDDENQTETNNDMDDSGFADTGTTDTVINDAGEDQNHDAIDDGGVGDNDGEDEFDDFDENGFEGYDDTINNNNNTNDLAKMPFEMQDNQTQ